MGRYNYEVVPVSMDEPESTAERQMRDEGLPSSASKLMSLFSTYLVITAFAFAGLICNEAKRLSFSRNLVK